MKYVLTHLTIQMLLLGATGGCLCGLYAAFIYFATLVGCCIECNSRLYCASGPRLGLNFVIGTRWYSMVIDWC